VLTFRWLGFIACAAVVFSWAFAEAQVRTVAPGTTIVHDDFAYTVQSVIQRQSGAATTYEVKLRVENRAKRVSYIWRDATAYIVDENGRRYDPTSQGSVRLSAGMSAVVHPEFRIPRSARKASLRFWDTVFMGDVFDGLRYARTAVALYCRLIESPSATRPGVTTSQ